MLDAKVRQISFLLISSFLVSRSVGQNPFTPAFPQSVANLPVANNGASSTLTSSINTSQLNIPVLNSLLFVVPTIVTIDSENIFILSKTGNVLNAQTRGFGGTPISSHSFNTKVNGQVSSEYFNMSSAEIMSIESHILNREFVSVKDFGCVGNGVTEDTACLVATYNYCIGLVNNCTIYFPPGKYKTHKWTLNQGPPDGSTIPYIVGAGQRQSILVGFPGDEILYVSSGDNGKISDLSFDCSAGSTIGLHVGRMGDTDISNIFAYNCTKYPIVLDATVNSNIQNIAAWGIGNATGATLGIVNNANGNKISRFEVTRWNSVGLYMGDDTTLPGFAQGGGFPASGNTFIMGIIECNSGVLLTCGTHTDIGAVFNNAPSNQFYNVQFEAGTTGAKTAIKLSTNLDYSNLFSNIAFLADGLPGSIWIDNSAVYNTFVGINMAGGGSCSSTHVWNRFNGIGLIFDRAAIGSCIQYHFVTANDEDSMNQINPVGTATDGIASNGFWLHGRSTAFPINSTSQVGFAYIKGPNLFDMNGNNITGYTGVFSPLPRIVFGIGNPTSLSPYSTWAAAAFPTQYVGTIFVNTTLNNNVTSNLMWIFNGFSWVLVK